MQADLGSLYGPVTYPWGVSLYLEEQSLGCPPHLWRLSVILTLLGKMI